MSTPSVSRYPRVLQCLMALLAILGFVVAAIGSRMLLAFFGVVYLMIFIAWALLAHSTEPKE